MLRNKHVKQEQSLLPVSSAWCRVWLRRRCGIWRAIWWNAATGGREGTRNRGRRERRPKYKGREATNASAERASKGWLIRLGYGTPRRPSGPALAPPIASRRSSCPRSGLLGLAPPAAAIHNAALRRCVVPCCPHWCCSCIRNCNPWEGEVLEESRSVVGDGFLRGGQQRSTSVAQCRGEGGCGVACVRHSISEPHPTAEGEREEV